MKKIVIILAALIVVLVIGCKGNDPISGTWNGTLILVDVHLHADTSNLAFTVTNRYGIVTGTVSADSLGWHSVPLTVGTYVSSEKSFGLTANVGGDDHNLVLAGVLNGTTLSGTATTTGGRAGTWNASK